MSTTNTVPVEFRNGTVTWLLWLFLGGFSAHLFYLGRTGEALVRLFTLQYLFVGYIIDLFTLNRKIHQTNRNIADYGTPAAPPQMHQDS